MKQYESYKDSGIEWLGEIPSHWTPISMKFYFYMKGRIGWQGLKADEFISDGPYLVTGTDFDNGKVDWSRCYHISDERYNEAPEIHVKAGDLLITKDGTVGKLAYIDHVPGKVSLNSHLLLIRPLSNIASNHFMYWALQADNFVHYTGLAQNGSIMASLSQEKIGDYKLALPSLSEQRIIASYLDDKVSQIDAVIAEKEKMVEDLQNYRKSVISEAVTRGLNPDVPMKDSGIDWIGMIPEHWSITNIGRLFYINAGGDAKPALYSPIKDDEHPFPVYTNAKEADHVYAFSSYAPFPGNSITVTGRGDIGHAIFRENEFDAIIRLLVLQPKQKNIIDSRYFAYFIDETIHFSTDSAAVGQLSAIQISPYKVCCPPIKEQKAISNYLEVRTGQIDVTIKCINSQIEDLKSYKSSLITEAVTGKIDLR